jgi:hypothetical protein
MSKESKCFDLNNPKQKKHYENWKRFIENLSTNKPSETEKESENKLKDKAKNFEDYFPVDTITKYYVNRLDYEPILGA